MPSIYRGNAIHNSIPSMVEYELDYSMTVTLIAEVDLSEVEKLRDKLGAEKPSYSALVIKVSACAKRLSLRQSKDRSRQIFPAVEVTHSKNSTARILRRRQNAICQA
jgi:hypothetical protein